MEAYSTAQYTALKHGEQRLISSASVLHIPGLCQPVHSELELMVHGPYNSVEEGGRPSLHDSCTVHTRTLLMYSLRGGTKVLNHLHGVTESRTQARDDRLSATALVCLPIRAFAITALLSTFALRGNSAFAVRTWPTLRSFVLTAT